MNNIIETAKEKLSELTDATVSVFQKEVLEPVKEYSIDKINEIWTEINNATEVLIQTGYSVTEISLSMSIPPSISINLNRVEDISDEKEEELLKENKDKTYLYSILVALFKANALQKNINAGIYEFKGINITAGLSIPTIDLKFKKV
jgi:divalent metal cation (Fe/Co/Zn/Cd) transporter